MICVMLLSIADVNRKQYKTFELNWIENFEACFHSPTRDMSTLAKVLHWCQAIIWNDFDQFIPWHILASLSYGGVSRLMRIYLRCIFISLLKPCDYEIQQHERTTLIMFLPNNSKIYETHAWNVLFEVIHVWWFLQWGFPNECSMISFLLAWNCAVATSLTHGVPCRFYRYNMYSHIPLCHTWWWRL